MPSISWRTGEAHQLSIRWVSSSGLLLSRLVFLGCYAVLGSPFHPVTKLDGGELPQSYTGSAGSSNSQCFILLGLFLARFSRNCTPIQMFEFLEKLLVIFTPVRFPATLGLCLNADAVAAPGVIF